MPFLHMIRRLDLPKLPIPLLLLSSQGYFIKKHRIRRHPSHRFRRHPRLERLPALIVFDVTVGLFVAPELLVGWFVADGFWSIGADGGEGGFDGGVVQGIGVEVGEGEVGGVGELPGELGGGEGGKDVFGRGEGGDGGEEGEEEGGVDVHVW